MVTLRILSYNHTEKIQDAAAKKTLAAQKGSFDVSDVYTVICHYGYTTSLPFDIDVFWK